MKFAASSLSLALLLLALAGSRSRAQGPPFQTDDPVPVEYQHFEAYVFAAETGGPSEIDTTGPAFEFNWGAVPDVQIHAVLPLGAIIPRNPSGPDDPRAFGLTDMEFGVKYAFIKQTKKRPQIGTFVMLEFPTGNPDRGLGVGKAWYKFPIWLYKDIGKWTLDGGAGYQVVPQEDFHDFPYGGFLLKRKLGEKLEIVAELFAHGGEGEASPHSRASTLIDAGGYYHFKSPGLQFLMAYGHSIAGQGETYAYIGLYKTWGKGGDAPGPDHSILSKALTGSRF